jgi:hypothetical protein
MDNITVIRMVAGVLVIILVGMIIARRKRMAVNKRLSARR